MDDLVLDEDEPTQPSTEAIKAIDAEWEIVKEALAVSSESRELVANFDARQIALFAAGGNFTKPPTNEEEQDSIIVQQRDLVKFRNEVVKKIKKLKDPLNEVREKLIALEKKIVAPISKEELRLQGFVQHRQQKLLDEKRRIEQEQALAARKTQEEAAEAQRLQAEAEKQRQAAELAKTEAEATALREQAAKLEDQALEKGLSAETNELPIAVQQEAPKAREVFDFEIIGKTDIERKSSLSALASAAPWMFTVHVSDEKPRAYSLNLSVRTLTESLNGNPPLKEPLPGIKIITKLTTLR